MTAGAVTDTAVNVSRAVVLLDHLKNNRLEYLLLTAIATVLGWTQQAVTYASGVCSWHNIDARAKASPGNLAVRQCWPVDELACSIARKYETVEGTEGDLVNLEDVLPFVPFIGTPYAVRKELQRSEQMTTAEAAKVGFGLGLTSFGGFVIAYELLGEAALTPMQVKVMREVWTKGPAVAAVATAAVAVTAASVVYEKKVNAPIRSGRQGIYFGPFASGFGPVVWWIVKGADTVLDGLILGTSKNTM